MALSRYLLCVPLIAALVLGGGGLHAVLEATGGCGHDHTAVAEAKAPTCCGHDHCCAGDVGESPADDAPAPTHDDSTCVVCVWMASGTLFQVHDVSLTTSERLPAFTPADYRYESRATLTPLGRGPPAV